MSRSAQIHVLFASVVAFVGACGGKVGVDGDGTEDGSTQTATTATPSGSGGAGGATTTGDGGTTAGVFGVTILSASLFADCMPVVGPDPIHGTITVQYDNIGTQPASIAVTECNLIDLSLQAEFPLALSPDSSGVVAPGASVVVAHQKVATPGESSGACQLCGQDSSVEMYWQAPVGGPLYVAAPLGCAF